MGAISTNHSHCIGGEYKRSIQFLVACFLAFATGTSWGTFGILIPIVVAVFKNSNYELMIISISACMAGAVCGDHCSPISDTIIMASAGAECDHVNHVSTQLPYSDELEIKYLSRLDPLLLGLMWQMMSFGIFIRQREG